MNCEFRNSGIKCACGARVLELFLDNPARGQFYKAERSSNAKLFEYGCQKLCQVIDIIFCCMVEALKIDLLIFMNQQISESSGFHHFLGKVSG